MAIVISLDVFCDEPGCAAWAEGLTGRNPLASEARAKLRALGWTRKRRGYLVADLCPEHSR